jgi:hypothetical protein
MAQKLTGISECNLSAVCKLRIMAQRRFSRSRIGLTTILGRFWEFRFSNDLFREYLQNL